MQMHVMAVDMQYNALYSQCEDIYGRWRAAEAALEQLRQQMTLLKQALVSQRCLPSFCSSRYILGAYMILTDAARVVILDQ